MDYSKLRDLLFFMYRTSPPNIQGRIEVWCDMITTAQVYGSANVTRFLREQLNQARIDMPWRYVDWDECIKALEE